MLMKFKRVNCMECDTVLEIDYDDTSLTEEKKRDECGCSNKTVLINNFEKYKTSVINAKDDTLVKIKIQEEIPDLNLKEGDWVELNIIQEYLEQEDENSEEDEENIHKNDTEIDDEYLKQEEDEEGTYNSEEEQKFNYWIGEYGEDSSEFVKNCKVLFMTEVHLNLKECQNYLDSTKLKDSCGHVVKVTEPYLGHIGVKTNVEDNIETNMEKEM